MKNEIQNDQSGIFDNSKNKSKGKFMKSLVSAIALSAMSVGYLEDAETLFVGPPASTGAITAANTAGGTVDADIDAAITGAVATIPGGIAAGANPIPVGALQNPLRNVLNHMLARVHFLQLTAASFGTAIGLLGLPPAVPVPVPLGGGAIKHLGRYGTGPQIIASKMNGAAGWTIAPAAVPGFVPAIIGAGVLPPAITGLPAGNALIAAIRNLVDGFDEISMISGDEREQSSVIFPAPGSTALTIAAGLPSVLTRLVGMALVPVVPQIIAIPAITAAIAAVVPAQGVAPATTQASIAAATAAVPIGAALMPGQSNTVQGLTAAARGILEVPGGAPAMQLPGGVPGVTVTAAATCRNATAAATAVLHSIFTSPPTAAAAVAGGILDIRNGVGAATPLQVPTYGAAGMGGIKNWDIITAQAVPCIKRTKFVVVGGGGGGNHNSFLYQHFQNGNKTYIRCRAILHSHIISTC
jgi:hypothetical protein